jgi:hypothetical protein
VAKKRKHDSKNRSNENMAQENKKTEAPAANPKAPQSIGVRLVPTGDSDLPILSNFARVQMSVSGILVDFGFIEPAGLDALARTARAGGKMPDAVTGRLAARFALTPDALVALHQQLGQAIAGLRAAPRAKKETGGAA